LRNIAPELLDEKLLDGMGPISDVFAIDLVLDLIEDIGGEGNGEAGFGHGDSITYDKWPIARFTDLDWIVMLADFRTIQSLGSWVHHFVSATVFIKGSW
jgi:hypothetical protein